MLNIFDEDLLYLIEKFDKEINFSKQASKFLKKQNKQTISRIYKAIYSLPQGDIKKLSGRAGYRLRVGNIRVIYDEYGNIIDIVEIENRGQIYKNK